MAALWVLNNLASHVLANFYFPLTCYTHPTDSLPIILPTQAWSSRPPLTLVLVRLWPSSLPFLTIIPLALCSEHKIPVTSGYSLMADGANPLGIIYKKRVSEISTRSWVTKGHPKITLWSFWGNRHLLILNKFCSWNGLKSSFLSASTDAHGHHIPALNISQPQWLTGAGVGTVSLGTLEFTHTYTPPMSNCILKHAHSHFDEMETRPSKARLLLFWT